MSSNGTETPDDPCAVIEAAPSGDAMFYGIWFQAVARAEALWGTGSMEERFYPLCRGAIPDLGMAAVQFLSSMSNKCCVIPLDQETMEIMTEFVMMIELGFFTLTGKRYQMTMPAQEVDVEAVRAAALKIVETEDEDFMIHPERFITAMRRVDAEEWGRRLSGMNEDNRCADREVLLWPE